MTCFVSVFAGGNQDGKFSVGFRDGIVRTVVGLDREAQAAYTLIVEAIGASLIHTFTFLTVESVFVFVIMALVLFLIFKAAPL